MNRTCRLNRLRSPKHRQYRVLWFKTYTLATIACIWHVDVTCESPLWRRGHSLPTLVHSYSGWGHCLNLEVILPSWMSSVAWAIAYHLPPGVVILHPLLPCIQSTLFSCRHTREPPLQVARNLWMSLMYHWPLIPRLLCHVICTPPPSQALALTLRRHTCNRANLWCACFLIIFSVCKISLYSLVSSVGSCF